jgi:hypothetical protein
MCCYSRKYEINYIRSIIGPVPARLSDLEKIAEKIRSYPCGQLLEEMIRAEWEKIKAKNGR